MLAVAKSVFWLAIAVWIGEVVFFSFVVAPTVFGALPQEAAGQVVGAIFPRYYTLGAITGGIAIAAALVIGGGTAATRPWAAIVMLLALMLLATTYAGWIVQPRAAALRPHLHASAADPSVRMEFDRLHRLAVQLNGAVLLLGVASICIAATTFTLPPK